MFNIILYCLFLDFISRHGYFDNINVAVGINAHVETGSADSALQNYYPLSSRQKSKRFTAISTQLDLTVKRKKVSRNHPKINVEENQSNQRQLQNQFQAQSPNLVNPVLNTLTDTALNTINQQLDNNTNNIMKE